MSLTYLYLSGYTPLKAVSGIKEIEISPTSANQIIMGGNGSGKSALAREWSPCPPDMNDYDDTCRKVAHYIAKGVTYKLESYKRKNSLVNSFVVIDGESGIETELNVSTTITEQRMLIKRHLDYDEKVHSILTMNTSLTRANGDETHGLFTMMYPHDLAFISRLFKRIKTAARDKTGTVKHLVNKLDDYQTKLDSLIAELPDDIDSQIDKLMLDAEAYIPFNVKYDYTETEILQRLDANMHRAKLIEEQWKRFKRLNVDEVGIDTLEGLTEHIGQLGGIKRTLFDRLTELDKVEREYEEIVADAEGELSEGELQSQIAQVHRDLQKLGLEGDPKYGRHAFILEELTTLQGEAQHYANYSGERLYTAEEIDNIQTRYERLSKAISLARDQLEKTTAELAHLEKHQADDLTCPKCHYSFGINGLSTADRIASIKTAIEQITARIEELSRHELHEEKLNVNEYLTARQRFVNYLSNKGRLHGLSVAELSGLFGQPNNVYQRIHDLKLAVEEDMRYSELLKTRVALNNALLSFQQHGTSASQHLNDVRTEAERIRAQLDVLNARLAHAERLKSMVAHFTKLIEEADGIQGDNEELLRRLTNIGISNHAANRLKQLHLSIGQLREQVNRRNALRDNLIGCRAEHTAVVDDEVALQLLAKLTSPKTGISAEYLHNFIKSFIDQMNLYIRVVSLLDVKVKYPVLAEDGTLDCWLMAEVNGAGVKRLNWLSKGQQRVVNLAFTLVCRHVLNLSDATLFLDEVADGLDTENRAHLYTCIRTLSEQGVYDQAFIVNHYDPLYSLLADPEVTILSANGVVVPKSYRSPTKLTLM